jgi:3-deoxy-D-manno-octulosonic-acid transferase
MEEDSAALPYSEPERAALARLFATRPVWLAADVPQAEEAAVIAAHRAALRQAHRLLLIVIPASPERAAALAALAEAEGWSVARRSAEEEPDPETEVFLADGGAEAEAEGGSEYGLWYRLAPITYLGGSLLGAGPGRDPREAAALGSALICGRQPGGHGGTLSRLAAARALRQVDRPEGLADALCDLLSPERAARLAQAAWAASSDGAEATARVLAELRRILDGEG